MGYLNFTDALMQAKRASQLRGTPFSTRDLFNTQSAYMSGAAERAAGERSAALAERAQTAQEKNWTDTLAQEKELAGLSRTQAREIAGMQMSAADKAANKALVGSAINTAGTLGGAYLISKALTGASDAYGGSLATQNAISQAGIGAPGAYTPATAGATLGPAAAGAAAIELGHQFITKPAVPKVAEALPGGEKEWGAIEKIGTRAGEGAVIGSAVPGVGTAAGAVTGGIIGSIETVAGGGCIIVTAATSSDSPEVNIAREYRDKFLTPETLRGYYVIAERVVPLMKNRVVKAIVKKVLVDPLIKFGKKALKNETPDLIPSIVTSLFLSLCNRFGQRAFYLRSNGEVL